MMPYVCILQGEGKCFIAKGIIYERNNYDDHPLAIAAIRNLLIKNDIES